MADTPSSASDLEKAGVKEAHHEHAEVHDKQLSSALRIDGDDEDHMHEPPVRPLSGLELNTNSSR